MRDQNGSFAHIYRTQERFIDHIRYLGCRSITNCAPISQILRIMKSSIGPTYSVLPRSYYIFPGKSNVRLVVHIPDKLGHILHWHRHVMGPRIP